MALHGVLGAGLLAVAFLQHLILQAAGQGDDAVLLGILGQVFLTCLLMYLALFGALLVDLLFLCSEILLHDTLGLAALYLQLITCQNILDGLREVVNIELGTTHIGQLVTNTDTQCITYFIHFFYIIIMCIFSKSGAKVQINDGKTKIFFELRAIIPKKLLILCILNTSLMKKIVVLTGAGMSVESGLKTFRDADGLWEEYPVQKVATHEGWLNDPTLVTNFYNMLRKKCWGVKPNEGHKLVAALEEKYNVTVVTQNVDNLHEQAGSKKVIHLHGELMKVCSSNDPDNPRYQQLLTPDNCEVEPGTKAGDGSLLRPFIVFFGEAVPMISPAAAECQEADIFIIIGTSLNVYPAAGLIQYTRPGIPIYLIDPKPVSTGSRDVVQIQKGASEGMRELSDLLMK